MLREEGYLYVRRIGELLWPQSRNKAYNSAKNIYRVSKKRRIKIQITAKKLLKNNGSNSIFLRYIFAIEKAIF